MFSFTNVIHIIIIFQGSLLLLNIFLSDYKKQKSDYLLASIIAALSLQMLGLFLANRNIQQEVFQSVNCLYGFLYGPLLFLYLRSITQADFKFNKVQLLHFLPAGIIITGILVTKGGFCRPQVYIGYAVHILTYIFFCFREISKYSKTVKDNYSRLEMLNLGWLKGTLLIFSLIVLVDLIQFTAFLLDSEIFPMEILVFLMILGAVNLLYFKGFSPARQWVGVVNEDRVLSMTLPATKRIDTDLEENRRLIHQLETHLKEKESFKNANLTIGLLAEELDMSKRSLSELINDHYDQNFVDFINTWRIEYAKERLLNPKDVKETILEVLYESGFNSKSSFNVAFKKKTGMTPSKFKAQ